MNKNIENWAQAWQLMSISASPPSLFPTFVLVAHKENILIDAVT